MPEGIRRASNYAALRRDIPSLVYVERKDVLLPFANFPHGLEEEVGTYCQPYANALFQYEISTKKQWLLDNIGLGSDFCSAYGPVQRWFTSRSEQIIWFRHLSDAIMFRLYCTD